MVINEGQTGVVGGGLLPKNISSRAVYRVTGDTGAIERLPPLTQSLHDSAGVSLAGRPIVVGGGGTTELSAVERFGTDHAWHVVGHLPTARSDLSLVPLRHSFLVVGGYDGQSSPRQVLQSRDGQRFTPFASLPHGVRYAAAIGVPGTVWIFGGEESNRELRTVQRLDTGARTITTAATLPTPLGHAAVAVVGRRLLLMGGRTSARHVTDKMWWFDPATRKFSAAGRLPYPVADAGVLTTSNSIYLLGGETPEFTKHVIGISRLP